MEVNPSRETLLWTEKTKSKILSRFDQVIDIATQMIQKELQNTDFLQWIKTCYSVYNKYSDRGGIIGRLAKIVDLSKAKFKFQPNEKIWFQASMPFGGAQTVVVQLVDERLGNGTTKRRIERGPAFGLGSLLDMPIILFAKKERRVNRKDKYLCHVYPGGFITVTEPYKTEADAIASGAPESLLEYFAKLKVSMVEVNLYWEALIASQGVLEYSEIEVPENFSANDEEEETLAGSGTEAAEQEAVNQKALITAEERRKIEGKTLLYTPAQDFVKTPDHTMPWIYQKIELPIAHINDWTAEEVYYGHDDDTEILSFIALLTRNPGERNTLAAVLCSYAENAAKWKELKWWRKKKWWRKNKDRVASYGIPDYKAYALQHFFDTKVMVFKVAKANARYYRDFKRPEEFFIQIHNKTITMSNRLIKWNTARLIRERLAECKFLSNFPFNPSFQEMYQELELYVARNYVDINTHQPVQEFYKSTYEDMIAHLDKVLQFQQFIALGSAEEGAIAALANELFGNRELRDGMAADNSILALMDELIEYSKACGVLPLHLPALTTRNAIITAELEQELRAYLDFKGVLSVKSSRETAADERARLEQEAREQQDRQTENALYYGKKSEQSDLIREMVDLAETGPVEAAGHDLQQVSTITE